MTSDQYLTGVRESVPFDLVLCAHGYERRCTHLAERFAAKFRWFESAKKIGLSFESRKSGNYIKNGEILEGLGFRLEPWTESPEGLGSEKLAGTLQQMVSEISSRRVLIDISSMSRTMMADCFEATSRLCGIEKLTFAYSPAKFYEPSGPSLPMEAFGPVTNRYRGWSRGADLPVSVVFGLGYEHERVMGAYEHLEPSQVILFAPAGTDERFLERTLDLNSWIIREVGQDRLLQYMLYNPSALFDQLRSIAGKLLESTRPVFVPLGPKIFALVSLFASSSFECRPAVWRVSAGAQDVPKDQFATGPIIIWKPRSNETQVWFTTADAQPEENAPSQV